MTTQLSLYQGALRLLGERKLASLVEAREPRRLLDDAWGSGATAGAVKHCLQLGQWTFAARTIQAVASTSIEPDFGYRYAFEQPSDMVRVMAVCEDEFFNTPLLRYSDERHYWYADLETIYVQYVSNDTDYGADLSLWPESFGKVVEAYLANEIVGNLTQSAAKVEAIGKLLEKTLLAAKSLDAMNRPTVMTPTGSWVSARRRNTSGSRWNGSWR